jgi:flagellar hook protein FlgE
MINGIQGLRTHAQKMDVISNDIANVNTVGYKQSQCNFKETLVSTLRTPAVGTPGMQIGMGSTVSSIIQDFTDGILLDTGISSNMAITGEGFFILREPNGTTDHFTRAGDFVHDYDPDAFGPGAAGIYLINGSGYRLRGVYGNPPAAIPADPSLCTDIILPDDTTSYSISLNGDVTVTAPSLNAGEPTVYARIPLCRFANNYGLNNVGNGMYETTESAGIQAMTTPGTDGTGQVFQNYLENSNVDLADEFTEMIITERGYQANSRSITTADEMLQELLSLKR